MCNHWECIQFRQSLARFIERAVAAILFMLALALFLIIVQDFFGDIDIAGGPPARNVAVAQSAVHCAGTGVGPCSRRFQIEEIER